MTDPAEMQLSPNELRQRAEALLSGRQIDFHGLSPDQAAALTHDLQIQQIQLELQNAELRRAQEELAEARDQYADLYDYAPIAYITTDGDGTIVAANLTAAGLLGVGRSQLIGAPLSDFVARPSQDKLYLHAREIFHHGMAQRCDLTMVRADGGTFPAQLDSVVSPDLDGGFGHCRTVITDVTERVRTDQALAQLRHREAIAVLAAGIAHDFNNLLTAVMGNHSLATLDLDSPEQLPIHLGAMGEGLASIRDLVQELLTLASPTPSHKVAVATKQLVETGAHLATTGGDVECTFALDQGLWPVFGNERAVLRVVQNLVSNAGDAMPAGGLVRILAENAVVLPRQVPELQAGRYVRISVADAGAGIGAENLARIFDPYFSTKARGRQRGMGLGLAICHAVVTEHGGAIIVDSKVGAGTTFHAYLPAADEPVQVRREVREEGELLVGQGRILLMDDQDMVRLGACKMLERLGYTPVATHDGEEAIRLYQEAMSSGEPFDAVILDLTVPQGMGGKATIKKLLATDPRAIVLISSGYVHDPLVTEHTRHGFRGVLLKPYGLAELGKVLSTVLAGE